MNAFGIVHLPPLTNAFATARGDNERGDAAFCQITLDTCSFFIIYIQIAHQLLASFYIVFLYNSPLSMHVLC